VPNIGFSNSGGGTLALRTRLFKPIDPAYPCLVGSGDLIGSKH